MVTKGQTQGHIPEHDDNSAKHVCLQSNNNRHATHCAVLRFLSFLTLPLHTYDITSH
jgi:hypothetical protein